MKLPLAALASGIALLASAPALAQRDIKFPDPSPRASASQTVGLAEMSVTYNRPAVNKRKIWGGLVPYGEVWRAGANENTVLTFSTPVTIGGTKLPAGSYGFHILPTETGWTAIVSKQSHAWGSFGYDAREDAVRTRVTPEPTADSTERLLFTFDDPTNAGVTLSLRWEKLRIPLPIEIDRKEVVLASVRDQLRGLPQFFPEGWAQAAGWCLQNDVNLDEAMTWTDKSIGMKETFQNLRVKAGLLEKKGEAKSAEAFRTKAVAIATEPEVNQLGYQLLAQGKKDEALALFQKNVKDYPKSWNAYDSLAEGHASKGEKSLALSNYQKAYDMVKQDDQKKRIQVEMAKLK